MSFDFALQFIAQLLWPLWQVQISNN